METNQQYPLGGQVSPPDKRDIMLASVLHIPTEIAGIPDVYDLTDQLPPVDMQIYGSCEGFTLMDVIEGGLQLRGQFKKKSGRFAYAMCKANDGMPDTEGTYTRIMLKVGMGVGVCDADLFPNEPKGSHKEYISNVPQVAVEQAYNDRLDGFTWLNNFDELCVAIYKYASKYGGCPITIPVFSDYLATDSNGVIQQPPQGAPMVGTHEVSAVGYDRVKGLIKIKNHWGNGWGKNGYAWLPTVYNGYYPLYEAATVVDFINGAETSGAPVNLAYPLKDIYITQHFGENPAMYQKFGLAGHNGTDFRAKTGTEVYAADDGVVQFVGVKGDYGNAVIIKHKWGISIYGHLQNWVVSDSNGANGQGQTVKKGQLIGHSDNTGNSTAPHLHFGIKINGVSNPAFADWVNAEPYFGKGNIMEILQVEGEQTLVVKNLDGKYYPIATPPELYGFVADSLGLTGKTFGTVSKAEVDANLGGYIKASVGFVK